MVKYIELDNNDYTFCLPMSAITACYHAASKDASRYYLHGVFIERDLSAPGEVVTVGTDGHILLKHVTAEGAHVGKSCCTQENGFILRTDVKDKAFKNKGVDVWVHGDLKSGLLQMFDKSVTDGKMYGRAGVCEFEQVDGTFPDYNRVTPEHSPSHDVMSFDPVQLGRIHKGALECLGHSKAKAPVSMSSKGPGEPITVHFNSDIPLTGIIMPCRMK